MEYYISSLFGKNVLLSKRDISGIGEVDIIDCLRRVINKLSETKKVKTFFDIGANKGNFSFISLLYPNLIVHAFEPNPNTFITLKENIKLNNLEKQITAYNLGVSNSIGSFKLNIPTDLTDHGLSTFGKNPTEIFSYDNKSGEYYSVDIDCKSLDSIFLQLELDSLDVIKIDTEGSELNILKGGEGVLRKYKPVILLEYVQSHSNMFGYDRTEIIELLKSYGYGAFTHINGRDSDLMCSEFEMKID